MLMMDRGLGFESGHADDRVEACRCINAAARLMSVFQDGLLTLQRLRIGGNQTVTVQHVTVASGGQAVIGNVQTRGHKRREQVKKWSCPYISGHTVMLNSAVRRLNMRGDSIFNAWCG